MPKFLFGGAELPSYTAADAYLMGKAAASAHRTRQMSSLFRQGRTAEARQLLRRPQLLVQRIAEESPIVSQLSFFPVGGKARPNVPRARSTARGIREYLRNREEYLWPHARQQEIRGMGNLLGTIKRQAPSVVADTMMKGQMRRMRTSTSKYAPGMREVLNRLFQKLRRR